MDKDRENFISFPADGETGYVLSQLSNFFSFYFCGSVKAGVRFLLLKNTGVSLQLF